MLFNDKFSKGFSTNPLIPFINCIIIYVAGTCDGNRYNQLINQNSKINNLFIKFSITYQYMEMFRWEACYKTTQSDAHMFVKTRMPKTPNDHMK